MRPESERNCSGLRQARGGTGCLPRQQGGRRRSGGLGALKEKRDKQKPTDSCERMMRTEKGDFIKAIKTEKDSNRKLREENARLIQRQNSLAQALKDE
eukprot:SAG22_NODE_565_length_9046_cov_142.250475_7_plen_98_part_00